MPRDTVAFFGKCLAFLFKRYFGIWILVFYTKQRRICIFFTLLGCVSCCRRLITIKLQVIYANFKLLAPIGKNQVIYYCSCALTRVPCILLNTMIVALKIYQTNLFLYAFMILWGFMLFTWLNIIFSLVKNKLLSFFFARPMLLYLDDDNTCLLRVTIVK